MRCLGREKVVSETRQPKRIQRKRELGWRKGDAVIVDRTSKYGNPFVVKPLPKDAFGPGRWTVVDRNGRVEGLRLEPQIFTSKLDATVFAVRFYELHTGPMGSYELDVDEVRRDLGGKDLACPCPPPEPGEIDWCHAAVLLRISNEVDDG